MTTASVVIASHNKPQYLEATLACLARQTRAPHEVIVIDDASDPPIPALPGATQVVRALGPRHVQRARNLGIVLARGDVILLMDDDCLVREDYVQSHLWRHERVPGHLVVGSVRRIHSQGEPEFWNLPPVSSVRERRTFASHAARLPGNEPPWVLAPCSNNVSVARETLLRADGYDDEFFGWGVDDVELSYRLMKHGVPMLMDSTIWVYHQEHARPAGDQAEEEQRNLWLFARRHGFWVYGDPPPEYSGPLYYPREGMWLHAQSIGREGEPAAIQVRLVSEPGAERRRGDGATGETGRREASFETGRGDGQALSPRRPVSPVAPSSPHPVPPSPPVAPSPLDVFVGVPSQLPTGPTASRPRASVIIPARNRADILPETLRSLARQSLPPEQFEVVVVDDGSSDGTNVRVRPADYPFRLVYQWIEPYAEFCPARPRNRGLRVATGEVAIFLDADILAGPDLVAAHLAAHDPDHPCGVIGYTYGYPLDPMERTPEALKPPPPDRVLAELPALLAQDPARWQDGREPTYARTRDLADHEIPADFFWTHNVSLPRALAIEIGGFDEEFVGWGCEDFEFALRLRERGVPFTVARGAWGFHYPHPLPDAAERRATQQRNRRRVIEKRADPWLELQLSIGLDDWEEIEPWLCRPPRLPQDRVDAVEALLARLKADVFAPGPLLLCGAFPAALTAQAAAWCQPFRSLATNRRLAATGLPSTFDSSGSATASIAFSNSVAVRSAGLPTGDADREVGATSRCANRTATPALSVRRSGRDVPQATATFRLLGVYTPWAENTFSAAVVLDYWRWLPQRVQAAMLAEFARVARYVALLDTGAKPAVPISGRPESASADFRAAGALPPTPHLLHQESVTAFVFCPPGGGS